MFKKKTVNDKQVLIIVRLIDASKKFLVFLVLFGQIWNLVPWNALQVKAMNRFNDEFIVENHSVNKYPTTTDSDFDQSKVEINSEMIDKRTATSKTFRKIDGTYEIALYDDVIHYFKEGSWKQIDNSLIDIGDGFETKDNRFKLKFPKKWMTTNKLSYH